MEKRSFSLSVSPETGAVSAEYIIPENCRCIMTLAHGAGAGMHHPFMEELATRLGGVGIGTLRFNFPFMEGRKGRPDKPAVAHATVAAAIERVVGDFPLLPVFVGGKSFGGRMSSQFVAGGVGVGGKGMGADAAVKGMGGLTAVGGMGADSAVKGMVFYGFPLHQPGKESVERAEHLKEVRVPMLFLQGTKDELAKWDLIFRVCSGLRKTRLVRIEGANHGFKAGKTDVVGLLVKGTAEWMKEKLAV